MRVPDAALDALRHTGFARVAGFVPAAALDALPVLPDLVDTGASPLVTHQFTT